MEGEEREALTLNSIRVLMLIPLTHYIWGPECEAEKNLAGIYIRSCLLLVSSVCFWVTKVTLHSYLICYLLLHQKRSTSNSVVSQFKQQRNEKSNSTVKALEILSKRSLIAHYTGEARTLQSLLEFFGWFVLISLTAGRYFRHHSWNREKRFPYWTLLEA